MHITRRHVIAAGIGSAAGIALGLAGCANQTASQLQSDVQTIDQGVSSIVVDLTATPGVTLPPATLAAIKSELAAIHADAAAIAAAATPNQTVVQTFSEAVSALVPLVTPFFPAAPAVAATVQAAVTLAQFVLAQVSPTKAAAVDPAAVARSRVVLQAAALRTP